MTQSAAAGVLQLQVGQYICNGHRYHCNISHRHRHHRHHCHHCHCFKKWSPRVAPLESKGKLYLDDWKENNTTILYSALHDSENLKLDPSFSEKENLKPYLDWNGNNTSIPSTSILELAVVFFSLVTNKMVA